MKEKRGENAFAVFYLPGNDEPQLISGDALIVEELTANGFVFAPYEKSEASPLWLIQSETVLFGEDEVSTFLRSYKAFSYSSLENITPISKEDFVSAVANGVEKIKASDILTKVVLSRPMFQPLKEDFKPWKVLQLLQEKMPKAFCFWVNIPEVGMWMGASPERLLEVKSGDAQTNALAATLPADSDQDWSEKEIDEQQIVSDYIAAQLEKAGVKDFSFTGPDTVKSGSVKHLKSVFDFRLNSNEQLHNTILSLHPTPAVCGMPKTLASTEICRLENYSRSYYTGYLGPYQGVEETHLFVNLRSMQIGQSKACLYIGAGITAASDPESEWEETEVKAETLLKVLEKD